MSFCNSKYMQIAAMLALAVVVSACGVKSSPGTPEGSTYPRTYPASPSGATIAKPASKRATSAATPGAYQPPPPATQLPN